MATKTKRVPKTIEEYQKELDLLRKEYSKIGNKITKCVKIIRNIQTTQQKEVVINIPFNKPEEITLEQWKLILYHWHDSTEYQYKISNEFLYKLGIWTNGIAGGSEADRVRQFSFSIHASHDADKYKAFYFLAKEALVDYKSCKDDNTVIAIGLVINMFSQSWSDSGHYLEIRKSDDMCRFIDSYSSYKKPTEWMTFDNAIEIIKKYQKIEIDGEDDSEY